MLNNLLLIETVLAYAYAASLPLTLTGSWVVLIIGLAVWFLKTCLAGKEAKAQILSLASAPFALPLLIFLLAVGLSGFANGGISEALNSIWSLRALLVYFWGYQLFRARRDLAFQSLKIVLTISAVSGLWSAIQQLTGFHPFGYQWLQGTGFLSAPMAYAGQMQLFSLIALAFAIGSSELKDKKKRFSSYLIALFNCLGILFAAERSAWLGFLTGIASLASLRSLRFFVSCALVVAVLGLFSYAFVPVVKQRLSPLANWQQDVSTRVRVQIWQKSLEIWQDKPLLGVGIRQFPRFDIPEAIVPGRSKDLNHAHSNYFQMLTCLGIVGLIAYLNLFVWILISLARSYRAAKGVSGTTSSGELERSLLMGLFASTVALMVSGLFEYNFGTAQVRLAQWFLLSIFVRQSRN